MRQAFASAQLFTSEEEAMQEALKDAKEFVERHWNHLLPPKP